VPAGVERPGGLAPSDQRAAGAADREPIGCAVVGLDAQLHLGADGQLNWPEVQLAVPVGSPATGGGAVGGWDWLGVVPLVAVVVDFAGMACPFRVAPCSALG
jgi:hypothetical protein